MRTRTLRRYGHVKENPLTTTQWALSGVVVLSVAGLIYYLTTTTTKSTNGSGGGTGAGTPPAGAFVLNSNTTLTQSVTIPTTGLTIALPVGGTWTGTYASFGSKPQFIPYTALAAGTVTIPLTWTLGGVAKTTHLMVTSTYISPSGGSGITVPPSGGITAGSTLGVGGILASGNSLVSPSGKYTFTMQTDGNLVLYNAANKALWASNTSLTGGAVSAYAVLQTDGNFVVYNNLTIPTWSRYHGSTATGTVPNTTYLTVQDDGNVVIYLSVNVASGTATGITPVWSTNTPGGVISTTWGQ